MSKNAKLVLFFLGATVFNIVLMVAMIAIFILLIGLTSATAAIATLFQVLIFVGIHRLHRADIPHLRQSHEMGDRQVPAGEEHPPALQEKEIGQRRRAWISHA